MSGSPTPRLGRAVRLFTPVVLAGTLTVPFVAGAKEHDYGHRWGAHPVAVEAAV